MAEKLIDVGVLLGLADELAGVARQVVSCDAAEAGLAPAVGDPGLTTEVDAFQGRWAQEREQVAEELHDLATALRGTAATFQQVDQAAAADLARAVVDA